MHSFRINALIALLQSYTKDGKAVEAEHSSFSFSSSGDRSNGEVTYSFKTAPAELIVAAETWSGVEGKSVRVDMSAGLALPQP